MGGSSKSATVGYKYYVGMHMVLTHGPVDKLLRVQVDERTAWQGEQSGSAQIQINKANLFGGESREGGISGLMDFETGASTQTPNSYLVSKLGAYVPGFRGVVGVVLRQMYMGLNPYLKKWSFRLSRVHTRQKGIAQWYDAKAEIEHKKVNIPYNQNYWKYLVTAPGDNSDYSSPSFDDSSWPEGLAGFGSSDDGGHYTVGTFVPSGVVGRSIWIRKKIYFQNPASIGDLILDVYHDDGAWLWWNGSPVSITATESYYYAIGNVPGSLVKAENTVVLKVTDGVPAGSSANIFGAVSIRSKVSLPQYDMNPAHIIRECLTDPDWGMGYQDADIDDASFIAAADRLYDEETGMSLIWDTQTSIEEFIKVVVKHIDAALYVERTTGEFVLKLIRNDYDVNSLIVLNESNIDKISDFTRPSFGELTNSVTVTYWDAETGEDSTLTVQDIALAQMQQCTINTSVQYPGFTNSTIATRVAQRDLKTLSTPLATCTIYANRDAASLNIGKCFKLSWDDYEVADLVMRVTGIAYGDGKTNRVRLQCVQDIFALPDNAFVQPAPPAWIDPTSSPIPVVARKVFEIPYLELVQTVGQSDIDSTLAATPEVGYVGAAAVRTAGAISARMFDDLGSGYTEIGNLDFSPGATLDGDINESVTTFAIKDGFDLDQVQLNTWFELDSEIMAVTAISATSITVKRGCLDTTPKKHLSGAYLVFWDNYAQGDNTELVSSEIAKVKICTVTGGGQLTLAEAPEDTVTIVGRAARPYPPANVKVNTSYFPTYIKGADLALTWVHRDRKQQTGQNLIGFTEASIGPEAGTTYTLRLYGEDDVLRRTETGLTGTGYTWTTETNDSGLTVLGSGVADLYWDNVAALLHFNGPDASTTFFDERGHTFTAFGNAQIDTAQSVSGGASGLFDGSGDYLSTPNSPDFNLSAGDWTIEAWIRINALSSGNMLIVDKDGQAFVSYPQWMLSVTADGKLLGLIGSGNGTSSQQIVTGATTISIGAWHHVAFTLSGTTLRLFLDGVLDVSATKTATMIAHTKALLVGWQLNQPVANYFNGHIDELRITKGVARYTASFTPPAAPFPSGLARLNGRVRFELESQRDGLTSFQHHNISVDRTGWGYNWGKHWGGPPP